MKLTHPYFTSDEDILSFQSFTEAISQYLSNRFFIMIFWSSVEMSISDFHDGSFEWFPAFFIIYLGSAKPDLRNWVAAIQK